MRKASELPHVLPSIYGKACATEGIQSLTGGDSESILTILGMSHGSANWVAVDEMVGGTLRVLFDSQIAVGPSARRRQK